MKDWMARENEMIGCDPPEQKDAVMEKRIVACFKREQQQVDVRSILLVGLSVLAVIMIAFSVLHSRKRRKSKRRVK